MSEYVAQPIASTVPAEAAITNVWASHTGESADLNRDERVGLPLAPSDALRGLMEAGTHPRKRD